MAVELEKLLEEKREEICVHIVAQVSSEMATHEALPVEDVRLASSFVAELNEASVRHEGQIWGDFVKKLRLIALGYKQNLGAVQDTTSRSTERFMFEPRAGVDQVYEKPCVEVVSQ